MRSCLFQVRAIQRRRTAFLTEQNANTFCFSPFGSLFTPRCFMQLLESDDHEDARVRNFRMPQYLSSVASDIITRERLHCCIAKRKSKTLRRVFIFFRETTYVLFLLVPCLLRKIDRRWPLAFCFQFLRYMLAVSKKEAYSLKQKLCRKARGLCVYSCETRLNDARSVYT